MTLMLLEGITQDEASDNKCMSARDDPQKTLTWSRKTSGKPVGLGRISKFRSLKKYILFIIDNSANRTHKQFTCMKCSFQQWEAHLYEAEELDLLFDLHSMMLFYHDLVRI